EAPSGFRRGLSVFLTLIGLIAILKAVFSHSNYLQITITLQPRGYLHPKAKTTLVDFHRSDFRRFRRHHYR
ncbi:hypothetical protein KKG05_03965, partial [bacterium]|nr:hypothetical protein [bacterium]